MKTGLLKHEAQGDRFNLGRVFRFSAEKPRRLRHAPGMSPRAAFRIPPFGNTRQSKRPPDGRSSLLQLSFKSPAPDPDRAKLDPLRRVPVLRGGATERVRDGDKNRRRKRYEVRDDDGAPGGIRFSAEKPRRLRHAPGMSPRAAFRIPPFGNTRQKQKTARWAVLSFAAIV